MAPVRSRRSGSAGFGVSTSTITRARFCCGGGFEFAQGWASLIPPDEEVSWQFPNHAPHYYAHFRAVSKSRETASLPLLRDLGRDWVRFDRDVEELVRFFPKNELRARVRLWDLLHQYAAGQEPGETDSSFHPHVQIALSHYPQRLLREAGGRADGPPDGRFP